MEDYMAKYFSHEIRKDNIFQMLKQVNIGNSVLGIASTEEVNQIIQTFLENNKDYINVIVTESASAISVSIFFFFWISTYCTNLSPVVERRN